MVTITKVMEGAMFIDMDHLNSDPHGCQKRNALHFMLKWGIQGGKELHEPKQNDQNDENS